MLFNGYLYQIFLLLSVLLFWFAPQSSRRWLVCFLSLAFYASWGLSIVLLPIGITLITYLAANAMLKQPDRHRVVALFAGIGTVLLVLAYFKYSVFIATTISGVLGLAAPKLSTWWQGALPLGISFYSFEAVSYLLDVRQGRVKEIRFLDLLLFIIFWPHLMAGPLVRVRELVPQLKFDRPFEARMFFGGIDRIAIGLVQKNVFANSLSGWVDDGFLPKLAATNGTIDSWVLAVAFGLQIYFDFAAYSNIAIGSAFLIGVTLPENFNSPYWAATPPEFWSRWHMTLSRWVRDYLFFPINSHFRGKPAVLYISMVSVMALVGLWHGAGWGFVIWGLLHGFYLALYRAYESLRGDSARQPWLIEALAIRALTLLAIAAAWIPFRAQTLEQTLELFRSMFLRLDLRLSYSVNFYLVVAAMILVCALEPWTTRLIGTSRLFQASRERDQFGPQFVLARTVIYSLSFLLFLAFDAQDSQFIYFQF
jgi:D-alanyl-lipoteichoic acid acyltransferase DltB (MBOAT superfamily)